jgi:MoxR-like ATPase
MKDEFISWLESQKPKSARHYTSGFNTIEKILVDNNLSALNKWGLDNYDINFEELKLLETFENLNSSGNNILTATLSNLKKFMEQKNEIIPKSPFDSFGWRWATTGIASHLNQPNSLRAVLDTILINGNGANNYTLEFKTLLYSICINKYSFTKEQAETLTKPSKFSSNNEPITIIENSGNYWAHLGLLTTTGKNAEVSELGKNFLTGELPEDDFVSALIDEYSLPNKAYKTAEINKWESAKLKIYPLKLIQNIFIYLSKNYKTEEQYITETELANIVIPCSYDLEIFPIKDISKHIVRYRETPGKHTSWPKPQNNYSTDKGFRMANEFLYFLEVFDFLSSNKINTVRSSDKKYIATNKFIGMNESVNLNNDIQGDTPPNFKISNFDQACGSANLKYSNQLITRYISSLVTKPFVLLSGLSGSGKTKLAQSFAQWISESHKQYSIVPVGADWTNREPLLGYVNALNPDEYVLPENGALQLLIEANKVENINKPYFLILDEMNLSHVERYFADFLSVMESKDKFKLHSDIEQEKSGVPFELSWPKNLFVVGTVNIDETTYMFSPKVLDRANAIEFRVTDKEITDFLNSPNQIDLEQLEKKGANMAADFIKIAINKEFKDFNTYDLNKTLVNFFGQLQKTGAEFGYRTGMEIHRLYQQLAVINEDISENDKIDIAVMQKLLPKLHGSRRKLCPILETLGNICVNDIDVKKDIFENEDFKLYEEVDGKLVLIEGILYPLSLEKITRMYKGAIENGFASYAEA